MLQISIQVNKVLIEERFNTYIEAQPLVLFNNETEMLHWAERMVGHTIICMILKGI